MNAEESSRSAIHFHLSPKENLTHPPIFVYPKRALLCIELCSSLSEGFFPSLTAPFLSHNSPCQFHLQNLSPDCPNRSTLGPSCSSPRLLLFLFSLLPPAQLSLGPLCSHPVFSPVAPGDYPSCALTGQYVYQGHLFTKGPEWPVPSDCGAETIKR